MRHQKYRAILAASTLSSAILSASCATAKPIYLTYYLPKVKVGAVVNQRLVACPQRGKGDIEVETSWTLKANVRPDYEEPVEVDGRAGFLQARTVDMTFNPDGTLTAINAKSESKAGPVIASVIKLAGTVAPLVAGVPLPPVAVMALGERSPERCNKLTLDRLANRDQLDKQVASIEYAIAMGRATQSQTEQLPKTREKLAAIDELLTLSATAEGLGDQFDKLKPCQPKTDCTRKGAVALKIESYDDWLETGGDPVSEIPGAQFGFSVEWAASAAAAKSLANGKGFATNAGGDRQMIYLRPVPAVVVAGPKNAAGEIDSSVQSSRASESLEFAIPQLSPRFSLPIGTGGLFGSREVKAAFDGFGRPTQLSYGSDPGADAMAGAIDAAGDAATSIHDAELTVAKNRVELEEAREKLKAFEKAGG